MKLFRSGCTDHWRTRARGLISFFFSFLFLSIQKGFHDVIPPVIVVRVNSVVIPWMKICLPFINTVAVSLLYKRLLQSLTKLVWKESFIFFDVSLFSLFIIFKCTIYNIFFKYKYWYVCKKKALFLVNDQNRRCMCGLQLRNIFVRSRKAKWYLRRISYNIKIKAVAIERGTHGLATCSV